MTDSVANYANWSQKERLAMLDRLLDPGDNDSSVFPFNRKAAQFARAAIQFSYQDYLAVQKFLESMQAFVVGSRVTPLILLDFDSIQAYADPVRERADFLELRHFFEKSNLPFAIPFGAIEELATFLTIFGYSEVPPDFERRASDPPSEPQRELIRAVNRAILRNAKRLGMDENKSETRTPLDGSYATVSRIRDLFASTRFSGCPREYETSGFKNLRMTVLLELRAEDMKKSRRRSKAKQDDASRNDALNALIASNITQSGNGAPAYLLSASRHLLRAVKRFPEIADLVVTPRTLLLANQLRFSTNFGAALTRVVEMIGHLAQVRDLLSKYIAEGKLSDFQLARFQKEFRKILKPKKLLLELEAERRPYISYRQIREELSSATRNNQLLLTTISYIRLLDLAHRTLSKHAPRMYETSIRSGHSVARFVMLDTPMQHSTVKKSTSDSEDGSERKSAKVICTGTILSAPAGDTNQTAWHIGWNTEAGFYKFVEAAEDVLAPRFRDTSFPNDTRTQPYAETNDRGVRDEEFLGVTVALARSLRIRFPASWIAEAREMRFLTPKRLQKLMSKAIRSLPNLDKERSLGSSTTFFVPKIYDLTVALPGIKLTFEVEPRQFDAERRVSLTVPTPIFEGIPAKLLLWLGPALIEYDGAVAAFAKWLEPVPANGAEQ